LDGHAATGNDLLIESQFRIIIDTNLLFPIFIFAKYAIFDTLNLKVLKMVAANLAEHYLPQWVEAPLSSIRNFASGVVSSITFVSLLAYSVGWFVLGYVVLSYGRKLCRQCWSWIYEKVSRFTGVMRQHRADWFYVDDDNLVIGDYYYRERVVRTSVLIPVKGTDITKRIPSFQCQVETRRNDTTFELVGCATRIGNALFFPKHLLDEATHLKIVRGSSAEELCLDSVRNVEVDLCGVMLTNEQFSRVGLSKPTIAGAMASSSSKQMITVTDGTWMSYGTVCRLDRMLGYLEYAGSTKYGFSGAAYHNGNSVYGVHCGAFTTNFGFEASYLESMYVGESPGTWQSNAMDRISEMTSFSRKQMKVKRDPFDSGSMVVAVKGGYVRFSSEDVTESAWDDLIDALDEDRERVFPSDGVLKESLIPDKGVTLVDPEPSFNEALTTVREQISELAKQLAVMASQQEKLFRRKEPVGVQAPSQRKSTVVVKAAGSLPPPTSEVVISSQMTPLAGPVLTPAPKEPPSASTLESLLPATGPISKGARRREKNSKFYADSRMLMLSLIATGDGATRPEDLEKMKELLALTELRPIGDEGLD
jgi:hypothetical protein